MLTSVLSEESLIFALKIKEIFQKHGLCRHGFKSVHKYMLAIDWILQFIEEDLKRRWSMDSEVGTRSSAEADVMDQWVMEFVLWLRQFNFHRRTERLPLPNKDGIMILH